ncbi:hypothetical protein PRIEUP_LOCUS1420, partial [Pristimantis euphronides]
ELFEQLEAAAGTADPRWLQARWARVLEAARPLTPEGGPAAPRRRAPGRGLSPWSPRPAWWARCGGRSGPGSSGRARDGPHPSTRPRPAGERGEASPHPAPSSSLGRRAAVRSTAVGRPGDVPAGGSTRRRETTRAESAGRAQPPGVPPGASAFQRW